LGISDPASNELDDAPGKQWLKVWTDKAEEKVDNLKQNLDQVTPARILPWVYAPFDGDARFKDKWHGHVIATPYLEYLLSPDDKPSEVSVSQFDVLADGPESVTFTTAAAGS
jgi:hypothetical protein